MLEATATPYKGFKFGMLWRLAKAVQRYNPRGIGRLLRAVYSPYVRQSDHMELAIEYDSDLLINIDTASLIEWSIFFYGHYEPEISNLIKRVVKPGYMTFDIGANIGCNTLIMARSAGEAGRVIAVEPNPKIYMRLTENISLNRMKNIEPIQCGMSNTIGELTLYTAPDNFPNQGMSSLYPQSVLSIEMPVKVQTLDSIMQAKRCDRLDFVKIDAQGSDYDVLLGGERSIQQYRPYLLFEYDENEWGRSNVDFAKCDAFFRKQEYRLYVLDSTGALIRLKYGLPGSTNIFAAPLNS